MRGKPSWGQSLSEYGLVMGLVVLAAIGGLVLLSGQTSHMLSDALDNVLKNNHHNPKVAVANPGGGNLAATDPAVNGPVAGTGLMDIRLGNGATLRVSDFPQDMDALLETSGGNGTTRVLLASLDKLVAQLEATGELPPAQAGFLRDLSNQGHRLAQVEALAEDMLREAASKGMTADEANQMTRTFEGQEVTLWWLRNQVDTALPQTRLDIQTLDKARLQAELVGDESASVDFDFVKAYWQARDNGSLDDPAVNQVVTYLANNIFNVKEKFGDALYEVQYAKQSPGTFKRTFAEQVTHYDSADICKTGQGQDSGVQCR